MRRLAAAVATASVLALLCGCTPAVPTIPGWSADPSSGILHLSSVMGAVEAEPDLFQPYLKMAPSEDVLAEEFEDLLSEGHATYAIAAVLASWIRGGETELAQERTERMLHRWDIRGGGTRASYGFPYELNENALEPGWWSGMSDWTFPLLLTALAQETGVEEYADIADALIAHARKSVTDGGSIWFENDECWISEYAWTGMSYEDEAYVLNGHQYGLAAMGIIAATTNDRELAELFTMCSLSTVEQMPKYAHASWFSYMLHERTINPPRYMALEIALFKALARLSGDQRHLDALAARQDAIAAGYPISGVVDETGSRLVFTQLAGPHPYLRDLYQIELECSDEQSTESLVLPEKPATIGESFIDVQTALKLEQTKCDVWSHESGAVRTLVSPQQEVVLANGDSPQVGFSVSANDNVEAIDSAFTVTSLGVDDPANDGTPITNKARIDVTLEDALELTSGDGWPPQFAVQVDPSTDVTAQIEISDGDSVCHRYYPPLTGGKSNVILLAVAGFSGCAIEAVSSITLVLGRGSLSKDVTLSNISALKFDGPAALRVHLSQNPAAVIPGF